MEPWFSIWLPRRAAGNAGAALPLLPVGPHGRAVHGTVDSPPLGHDGGRQHGASIDASPLLALLLHLLLHGQSLLVLLQLMLQGCFGQLTSHLEINNTLKLLNQRPAYNNFNY